MGAGDFFKTIGKTAFPFITLAANAGGPFTAMAAQAVGSALGLTNVASKADAIEQAMAEAAGKPEMLLKLKEGEQAFQLSMAQLTNDKIKTVQDFETHLQEIAAKDRADARAMQVQTRSWIVPILAVVIITGFLLLLLGLLLGKLKVSDQQALLLLLGGLNTSFGAVVMYYFGSSAGSERKTDLLAKADAVKE